MRILAIETSCDDTCIAVIRASGKKKFNFNILSNVVSSQVEIHKKWGGVYPTLAKREHQRNLVSVLTGALKQSKLLKISKSKFLISNKNPNDKFQKLKEILEREEYLLEQLEKFLKKHQKPKIDAIAITNGPGLEPCLWVGVNFAKALSYYWDIPIVPINHIEAHILANLLPQISETSKSKFLISNKNPNDKFQISKQIKFPAICLVVSGGHTQLILMSDFGKYKILGETRDDAAGECFDKVAKILGLGYPGGPVIATKAKKSRGRASVSLPRPMIYQKNYDFSFSGLKTAVLYDFKKRPKKIRDSKQYIQEMCYETQQAIIDVLIKKTIRSAKAYRVKAIILGGGVTANQQLRAQFQQTLKKEKLSFKFYVPSSRFCTDNAAMAGVAGYLGWLRGKVKGWKKVKAKANLRIK